MKLIKIIVGVLVVSAFVIGQTSVVNSSHNLSTSGDADQASDTQTRVCVFCHTPHNGSVDVLWNRTNPLASDFTVRS
ncbi:MAG: cytochrome C, partial [Planctomycetia bacterium]|nr:cytochrome C [Planctomycetia bacterium]